MNDYSHRDPRSVIRCLLRRTWVIDMGMCVYAVALLVLVMMGSGLI